MAFNIIDNTTPKGTDVMKTIDDSVRTLKSDIINNFQEISGYPNNSIITLQEWTTSNRPSTNLKANLIGYNSDLKVIEKYDGSSSWIAMTPNITLSQWTVAERPSTPFTGQYGYNSDLNVTERYNGSAWTRVSGGRRGDIKMWSGSVSDIETGWCLADGVQRTHPEGGNFTPPNLKDRFILGAGNSYGVGVTGGEATHTLTIAEMPYHNHGIHTYYSSGVQAPIVTRYDGRYDAGIVGSEYTGGGLAHNNLPPYYALCFLYKL